MKREEKQDINERKKKLRVLIKTCKNIKERQKKGKRKTT